ncbi:hypothetical protein [Wukongibacter sp. M2B1]|uniref:hypothetical protein n=1 Tax=Wukongibacter sp. M2B1 TaxID=3088895 RepID=UPI003D792C78
MSGAIVYATSMYSASGVESEGTAKVNMSALTEGYSSKPILAATVDTDVYMDGDLYDNPTDSDIDSSGSGEAIASIDETYTDI